MFSSTRSRSLRTAALSTIAVLLLATAALLIWPRTQALLSGTFRDKVEFSRDIRPILNQNCMSCHGGVRQKNNVSFLFREEALGTGKSGRRTIVPGKPDASEFMARLTTTDPEQRMPYHAPPLQPTQIAVLREWIKEGAKWEDYWAFEAPKRQTVPEVKDSNRGWVRDPIDGFILARLEKEGLDPSPEANKSALLRRVSFDLTGLPPTIAEESAFLADSSPSAYEKQVDRLLASPAYGERWASMWLDLARYADSKGYEVDPGRPGVWPYRDWVIDAFNRNLPYDQFVIKQLAGDLLPNATFEDRIATSFHRQTPNNTENGTDDEEYRIVSVMDRVATTWSVLTGVTMNCVQCHSHPYDPIRHADYYKSMAFFNTQADADLNDDSPSLMVPKDKTRYNEAARIQDEIATLLHMVETTDRQLEEKTNWVALPIEEADANEVKALEPMEPELERKVRELEGKTNLLPKDRADRLKDLRDTVTATKKRLAEARISGPAKTFKIQNGESLANANTPARFVYELTASAKLPIVTAIRIEALPVDPEKAVHTPEDGFIVDRVEGWAIGPDGKRDPIPFHFLVQDSEANLEAAVAVETEPQSKLQSDFPVSKGFAALPKIFRPRWMIAVPSEPLQLQPGSHIQLGLTQIQAIAFKPAIIKRARLSVSSDLSWTSLVQEHKRDADIDRLKKLKEDLAKIPSVALPVMVEEQPYEDRASLEFERGNFLTKVGPNLSPDVPAIFPKLPEGAPRNRLTLAKWFFAPTQPLTARVAVNRYWEELFGTGLVETLENFGSVGEEPSHPELLDWLALHFQNDLHWDMKALLRELVTSATYRQTSVAIPAITAKDPRNRLLSHGPQQRLTAEMVRDQALVASGLLSREMGGPPVMPPQPAGVWDSAHKDQWTDATGRNRYRRAVYTYIKRTSGYPSFLMFDSSDRDISLPRRIATNTPLQALVTLNDPVYQEAAEALARRVVKETSAGSPDTDIVAARLAYEARLVLSRDATASETTAIREFYDQALAMPRRAVLKNASMEISPDALNLDKNVSPRERDALTAVGSVLFNLDSALKR